MKLHVCNFCGVNESRCSHMVVKDDNLCICAKCVALCAKVIEEGKAEDANESRPADLLDAAGGGE